MSTYLPTHGRVHTKTQTQREKFLLIRPFDVYVKYVIYLFIFRLRHYDADLVTAPTAVYIAIFCCFL